MPRSIQRLRVFLASPSDTAKERECLQRVVTELNRLWSDLHSLELELVRWETHAYPGFGSDAQDVINREIGDDYEIFIGILWSRFGTPTQRAPSGTQEEFEKAYHRYVMAPESISLLFYFKDSPVPPSQISPADIELVQKFKARIASAGGLYWCFETEVDFEPLVRLHLAKVLKEWGQRIESPASGAVAVIQRDGAIEDECFASIEQESCEDANDLGYLDYMEMATIAADEMNACLERMTLAMTELSKTFETTVNDAKLSAGPSLETAKDLATAGAQALRAFSNSTSTEIPIFGKSFQNVLIGLSGAASIAVEENFGGELIQSILLQVRTLKQSLGSAKGQMKIFRDSVEATPRMTKDLIQAKREALRVLDSLDTEFTKSLATSERIEMSTEVLLPSKGESEAIPL
jgi:hypothetical protein